LDRVSDISEVSDRLESVSDISEDEIVLDEEYSEGLESVSDISEDINNDEIIDIADNDQQGDNHSSSNRSKRSIEPKLSSSNDLMPVLKKSRISNSNGGANERFLREFMNGNRSTSPDLEYADAIIKQQEREINDKKKRLSTETCDESEIVVQFGKQIPEQSSSSNCIQSSTDYDYYKRDDDYDGSFESSSMSYPEINLERHTKISSVVGQVSYTERSSERCRGSRERSLERSIDKYRDISSERSYESYPERTRESYDDKSRERNTEGSNERWRERLSQDDERSLQVDRRLSGDQELLNDKKSGNNRRLPYDRKKPHDIKTLPYDRTNPETLICDNRRLPVASQNNESSERKLLLEKKLKLMDDIEKLLEQNEDVTILPKIDDIVSKISNDIDSKRKSLSDYRLYPQDHWVEGLHQSDVPYQEGFHQSKVSDHQSDVYHEGLNQSNVNYQEKSHIPLAKEITKSYQKLSPEIPDNNKKPGAAFYASHFGKLLGSSEPSFKKAVHKRAGPSKTVINAGTGSSGAGFYTETSSTTAVHSQVPMPPVINSLATSNQVSAPDIVQVAASHVAAVSQLAAANASSYSNSQHNVAASTGSKWSKPALKINSKEPMDALYEFSEKKAIPPPWYNAVQAKGYSPINTVWMTCKIDGKEFSATGCTNMVAKKNVAYVAWEAIKEEYINFLSL